MTTNAELIEIMAGLGMDTRPDPRTNRDAEYVAGLLKVSKYTVISWLAPKHWKNSKPMPGGYLELLEIKLEKNEKKA